MTPPEATKGAPGGGPGRWLDPCKDTPRAGQGGGPGASPLDRAPTTHAASAGFAGGAAFTTT
jgi:hypothetical protein